jgi:hypothetical protein
MSAQWHLLTPAPRWAVLEVLPGWSHQRKAILFQSRTFESTAICLGETCHAVAMMRARSCGRVEFALVIRRSAAIHMRPLIRIAQLTLSQIAQDRLVFARVHPANDQGQRMARLTGFVKSRAGAEIWIWRGNHGSNSWRREQRGGRGGGGATEKAAAGGQ